MNVATFLSWLPSNGCFQLQANKAGSQKQALGCVCVCVGGESRSGWSTVFAGKGGTGMEVLPSSYAIVVYCIFCFYV